MSTDILNAWNQVALLPVGGLTEIGFAQDERYLLVLSWQGRRVVDTTTGQKVARDPEAPCDGLPWLNGQSKSINGIGPIEGEAVHCVGLWGGTLPVSSGRFTVGANRRAEGEDVTLADNVAHTSQVLQSAITEIRAMGFSPSGDLLVVATSSDVQILRRAATARCRQTTLARCC
jgi:hypothetical protein